MEFFRRGLSRKSAHGRADLRAAGFSLLELLVAVAIVAILASIAIPSYSRYVTRGHRSDAQRLMTTISNREAQYLLDARAFTTTIGAGGLNITTLDGWTCEAACRNSHYTVAVALEGTGYSVTATPSASQAGDGVLVIKSSGERSRTVAGVNKGW